MTQDEKMIWATVFASHYKELYHPPSGMAHPGNTEAYAIWERGVVSSAIENAGTAIQYAREALPDIKEGFGKENHIYKFLIEMVEGE